MYAWSVKPTLRHFQLPVFIGYRGILYPVAKQPRKFTSSYSDVKKAWNSTSDPHVGLRLQGVYQNTRIFTLSGNWLFVCPYMTGFPFYCRMAGFGFWELSAWSSSNSLSCWHVLGSLQKLQTAREVIFICAFCLVLRDSRICCACSAGCRWYKYCEPSTHIVCAMCMLTGLDGPDWQKKNVIRFRRGWKWVGVPYWSAWLYQCRVVITGSLLYNKRWRGGPFYLKLT